jgi:hypothetical protein
MRQILREIDSLDRAVYRAIAQTATPTLDHDLRVLSRSADHSVLWLSIAGALAVVPGRPQAGGAARRGQHWHRLGERQRGREDAAAAGSGRTASRPLFR